MESTMSENPGSLPKVRLLLVSAAIGIAAFLVFSPALNNGFVSWDDDVYVTDNPRVQHPSLQNFTWFFGHAYFRSYTPLTFASHMLDYALWGDSPRGHHLHNLLLHALNTVWMFWLGLMLILLARSPRPDPGTGLHTPAFSRLDGSALIGGALGALAFGLHPLRAESAAWVSDRKDLLAACFLLPTFMTYLLASVGDSGKKRRGWLSFSAFLFLCSILAKSISATAPLVMILLDLMLLHPGDWRRHTRRLIMNKLPYLLVAGIAAGAAFAAIPEQGLNLLARNLSPAQKALLPLYSITFYLGKLVWPLNLAAVYEIPPIATMAVFSTLALLLTALFAVRARMARKVPLLAWLTYIILISPTILFLSSGIQPLADRYTYLATAPLFLAGAGGIALLWQSTGDRPNARTGKGTVLACMIAILLCFTALSRHQVRFWKDSITLWSHAMQVSPTVPASYNSLGVALGALGRGEEAIAFFKEALRLNGEYAVAWNNLGIIYKGTGSLTEAVASFRKSALCNPESAEPFIHLGEIAEQTGTIDSALSFYRRSRAIDPDSPTPYARLGSLFSRIGNLDSASAALTSLVTLRPDDAQGYFELAGVLERTGHQDDALRILVQSAQLGYAGARRELTRRGLTW
jgi:Flp pilus assembly protein TadD